MSRPAQNSGDAQQPPEDLNTLTDPGAAQQEITRLRKLLSAYEHIARQSERELVKANRIISAYEEVHELPQDEILQLRQQMQSSRRPVEVTLEDRILRALGSGKQAFKELESLIADEGERFYTDFFRLLVHQEFDGEEAHTYWEEIVNHTHGMSRAMGRPVPFRVAMVDYFLYVNPVLHNPKLVEISTFEDMIRSSFQDALTGLYNRRYLDRSLLQEVHRAERYGHSVAVLVVDIDDFKYYNDNFGHAEGDEVMRTIGALMLATFREEDVPCRYGGEEFVVILPETDSEQALRTAARFMEAVRSSKFTHGKVTISGGIAHYPRHGRQPGEVFLAADQALYRAKSDGKDRIYAAK